MKEVENIILSRNFCQLNREEEYRVTLEKVTDVSQKEGICLELELYGEDVTELEVTLYPLHIARPEFFPEIRGRAAVAGKGMHRLDIPFEQFEFRQMVRAFLNYLDGISVRVLRGGPVLVKEISACNMGDFQVRVLRDSLAGESGTRLEYTFLLSNQGENRRLVNVSRILYGKECLPAEYERYVELAGAETREYKVTLGMTEDIPRGGLEKSEFLFVPDGDGVQGKRVTLYAAKSRKHPYLFLTGEQWERRTRAIMADRGAAVGVASVSGGNSAVNDNSASASGGKPMADSASGEKSGSESGALYEAFRKEYVERTENWKVPEVSMAVDYVYPSYSQNDLFPAAVAWKVTGNGAYLDKAMGYLRGLLDGQRGYLTTKISYFQFVESKEEYARGDFKVCRAQNAGWVQEAEFFHKVAISYDLLYEHFTPEEHRQMERCLRNYMDFAAWRLTDGDGNNFQVAEAGAGLFCAMALQDYGWVQRFLYGYNGITDLLSAVFLDDGMYFEEASGYVRLAGELFLDIANGAENFGISLKDVKIPASFDRNILHSPWAMRESWAEDGKPFLGMSFRRFETFTQPVRCLKDYFDCTAKLLTDKGIMMSVNDSNEQDMTKLYQKAYYLYGDPLYGQIGSLAAAPETLLLREEAEAAASERLPLGEKTEAYELGKGSLLLSGAGFGILREEVAETAARGIEPEAGENGGSRREPEGKALQGGSPVQAVLKFGSHGGYHGHYDRLSLLSFLKDGKTFHNNEYAWFGYDSFLFKMWVQTSVAHNMTVVDGRMQKPSPCRCVYFAADERVGDLEGRGTAEALPREGTQDTVNAGKASAQGGLQDSADGRRHRKEAGRETDSMSETFSAVCAQTVTEWIDPPYGGQTPYPLVFPEEKCAREGRFILMPEQPREQGAIGTYSEPVFQRRMLILFHGYCIVWDYLEGQQEHRFDCLYHPMGRFDGKIYPEEVPADGFDGWTFRERFSEDPFGAGQFIQNCRSVRADGTLRLHFRDAAARVNGNDILDNLPETTLWRAWPESGEVTVGKYPQKGDTFTEENRRACAGYLDEPLKKTVSFSAEGRKAGFITILEAGEKTGRIKTVECPDFNAVLITERNGSQWRITAEGMGEKDAAVRAVIIRQR
ncbi:MAG: hypothetical protein HFH91_00925 [Lachnospiraceae bacterium]|nr:hypothetical protein [Lachnospiraceae bacterium]